MQAMWKHRRARLERGPSGRFGRRGLPFIALFRVLLPLLAPLLDLMAIYGAGLPRPRETLLALAGDAGPADRSPRCSRSGSTGSRCAAVDAAAAAVRLPAADVSRPAPVRVHRADRPAAALAEAAPRRRDGRSQLQGACTATAMGMQRQCLPRRPARRPLPPRRPDRGRRHGQVWRATDTVLGRDVAVKMLHPARPATPSSRRGSATRRGPWPRCTIRRRRCLRLRRDGDDAVHTSSWPASTASRSTSASPSAAGSTPPRRCRSWPRPRALWRPHTRPASCTATSSPAT